MGGGRSSAQTPRPHRIRKLRSFFNRVSPLTPPSPPSDGGEGGEGAVREGIMRTLITGGAGFIGSHLCERFLAEGHEVICVDNLITGTLTNIDPLRADQRF